MQRISPGQSTFTDLAVAWRTDRRGRDLGPGGDVWRTIWPMTCDGSMKAPGVIAREVDRDGLDLVGPDRVESGMSTAATTTGPVVGVACVGAWCSGAPDKDQDPDEGHDRQEDPDEQDEPIRALQVGSPRQGCVTGGTTLALAQSRATIPKD